MGPTWVLINLKTFSPGQLKIGLTEHPEQLFYGSRPKVQLTRRLGVLP